MGWAFCRSLTFQDDVKVHYIYHFMKQVLDVLKTRKGSRLVLISEIRYHGHVALLYEIHKCTSPVHGSYETPTHFEQRFTTFLALRCQSFGMVIPVRYYIMHAAMCSSLHCSIACVSEIAMEHDRELCITRNAKWNPQAHR
jgi:hypothetical protein